MVQCAKCKGPYHMECVGADERSTAARWLCKACAVDPSLPTHSSSETSQQISNRSGTPSTVAAKSTEESSNTLSALLKRLEESEAAQLSMLNQIEAMKRSFEKRLKALDLINHETKLRADKAETDAKRLPPALKHWKQNYELQRQS